MLDIIIISNSSKKDVLKTIHSILYQIFDIKYKVYILDCNKKIDYIDIVEDYSKVVNIKELKYDNLNIGLAKRYALEKSDGNYIMFINSGDVLSFPFALDFMYSHIKENDIVYSPYFEKYEDHYRYIKYDEYTLNSKMINKKFIKENNISFSDLDINISYSFNYLLKLKKAKMFFLDNELLITKSRNIIPVSNSYQMDYFNKYIDDIKFILNSKISKKDIGEVTLSCLYYSYLYYLKNKKIIKKNDLYDILKIYQDNKTKNSTSIMKNCIINEDLIDLVVNANITFNDYIDLLKDEVVL